MDQSSSTAQAVCVVEASKMCRVRGAIDRNNTPLNRMWCVLSLAFVLFKAGIPPLYFEAGRDGSFQTLVARGAGLCAADSRRKNGFQSVDVR